MTRFVIFRLADVSGIDLKTISALIKKYNIESLGISEFNKVHKITNSAGMSDFLLQKMSIQFFRKLIF